MQGKEEFLEKLSLQCLSLIAAALLLAGPCFAQQRLILEPYLLDDSDALPALAGDQEESREDDTTRIQNLSSISLYEQAIEVAELQEGPFSFELAEQLSALGDLYQELGDYEQAITNFEAAQYILRVNNGLFTPDQTPLVGKIRDSRLALGQQQQAADMQEYLYYLIQKNYDADDPEFTTASLEQVDWYLSSFLRDPTDLSEFMSTGARSVPSGLNNLVFYDRRYRAFFFVPRIDFSFNFNDLNLISTYPNLHIQNSQRFSQARQMLLAATEGEENQISSSQHLRVLHALANTAYLAKEQLEYIDDQVESQGLQCVYCNLSDTFRLRNREYENGMEALETVISILQENPDTPLQELARARLDLADWHLVFGYQNQADELYLNIFEDLQSAGLGEEEIDSLMNPEPLLLLPDFIEQPYSAAAWDFEPSPQTPFDGYVDVELTRNSEGEFANIAFSEASLDEPNEVLVLLFQLLKTQNSRPTLDNGVPLEEEILQLRYYYAL